MADADKGEGVRGAMGLRGVWAQVANLGAVSLVCLMFWQSQQGDRNEAREDRRMFREEMKGLHSAGLVRDQVLLRNQYLLEQNLRRMEMSEDLQRQTVQALRDVARCIEAKPVKE